MSAQLSMFIVTAVVLLVVFRLVAKGRLLLKYSLIWIILFIVTFLATIFPEPLFWLARTTGFKTPSNFVLVLAVFFLLALCLSLSVIASRNRISTKNLVQELAIQQAMMNGLSCRLDAVEAGGRGPARIADDDAVRAGVAGARDAGRASSGSLAEKADPKGPSQVAADGVRDDGRAQAGATPAKEF